MREEKILSSDETSNSSIMVSPRGDTEENRLKKEPSLKKLVSHSAGSSVNTPNSPISTTNTNTSSNDDKKKGFNSSIQDQELKEKEKLMKEEEDNQKRLREIIEKEKEKKRKT